MGCPKLPTLFDDIGTPANTVHEDLAAKHYNLFAESGIPYVPKLASHMPYRIDMLQMRLFLINKCHQMVNARLEDLLQARTRRAPIQPSLTSQALERIRQADCRYSSKRYDTFRYQIFFNGVTGLREIFSSAGLSNPHRKATQKAQVFCTPRRERKGK